MFPSAVMSINSTCLSEETSCVSSFGSLNPLVSYTISVDPQQKIKKKRNLPGNPDPDAEVIALSPKTLMATNRFVCEICNKGFQRDQNLQLHRRGHNLPWKLKQRNSKDVLKKKAYVCPEPSCVHHHPSRALGDLTGIKKHFCRKHGEKKWKCDKCSKIYAVQSDWKAHTKTCGTREYRCDCGTLFSRKDGFVTHRAFCDALAEESARLLSASSTPILTPPPPPPIITPHDPNPNSPQPYPFSLLSHPHFSEEHHQHYLFNNDNNNNNNNPSIHISLNPWDPPLNPNPNLNPISNSNPNPNRLNNVKPEANNIITPPFSFYQEQPPPQPPSLNYRNFMTSPFHSLHVITSTSASSAAHLSATALLQKAASVGAQSAAHVPSAMSGIDMDGLGHVTGGMPPENLGHFATWQQKNDVGGLTRDFLGLTGGSGDRGNGNNNNNTNNTNNNNNNNNNNVDVNVNVNVNVRNLLTFRRGVEFPTYEREHSAMRTRVGFGTEPAASETRGHC